MADVAGRLGVSKMTVSRVVNGQPGVSEKTRVRIRAEIERLEFIPSQRGRSLAVGRSNVIGMIVLNVTSEWVWQLVLGAGQAAEEIGHQLLLRTTGAGEVASFDTQRPIFGSDLIDGVVIVSWRVPMAFASDLTRHNVPAVLIDAYERPKQLAWVSAEDRAGARAATEFLIGQGHRRIAFIGGESAAYLTRQRLQGFRDGLEAGGLSREACVVAHGDYTRQSGFDIARKVLRRAVRPTAVFAANDEMAVGVMDAAQERGLSVPHDLSVVGFDDLPIASHVNPTLTTVARPYRAMGATAVRLVSELLGTAPESRASGTAQIRGSTVAQIRGSTAAQIRGNTAAGIRTARQVDLPVQLIQRASTAPLSRGERR
jgi:LacI family transcriptional regulator